jgi:hypothetical protein
MFIVNNLIFRPLNTEGAKQANFPRKQNGELRQEPGTVTAWVTLHRAVQKSLGKNLPLSLYLGALRYVFGSWPLHYETI